MRKTTSRNSTRRRVSVGWWLMVIVVQVIITLGNDILKNLRVEDPIDDVAVFFGDEFYIQFF
jgi:hypothetical protein